MEGSNENFERLYKCTTGKFRKAKTADDPMLTTLPSETLRWMKQHRPSMCKDKVPITHFRERQLREIFKVLDFQNAGYIDLGELKFAAKYVEEHEHGQFKNVSSMFAEMDEDGDGAVDFQEFVLAMSGKSAFEKASEEDIEKLFLRFMEYGRTKKHEFAVQAIYSSENNETAGGATSKLPDSPTRTAGDLGRFKYFGTLFGMYSTQSDEADTKHEDNESETNSVASVHVDAQYLSNTHAWEDKVMDDYVKSTLGNKGNLSQSDIEYEKLYQRTRESRLLAEMELKHDPELRTLQLRIAEEKKYLLLSKKHHRNIQSRSRSSLPTTTSSSSTSALLTKTSPNAAADLTKKQRGAKPRGDEDNYDQTADNLDAPACNMTKYANKGSSTRLTETMIPYHESVKHDLQIQQTAVQEAYGIMRTCKGREATQRYDPSLTEDSRNYQYTLLSQAGKSSIDQEELSSSSGNLGNNRSSCSFVSKMTDTRALSNGLSQLSLSQHEQLSSFSKTKSVVVLPPFGKPTPTVGKSKSICSLASGRDVMPRRPIKFGHQREPSSSAALYSLSNSTTHNHP